ncbi:hypothetical protein [Microbacterium sp. AK031]|uniref:hypothetical protein n=1 Tax=Microbacterium sp. AK031 TaxID=2723076 RepID=UPI0021699AC5|nr:hypothetical protein [Microbacterium sp. AK031]MCS3844785.1 hypothetical protein [Microbacterium sp. AK031]
MDPISPAIVSAGAHAAKATDSFADEAAKAAGSLLTRLFGPSADVIGANWADRLREQNMERLLKKTEKRAKARETKGEDPGIANPRVASQVFASAEYSDSEVVAEYLSGVLASSRDATGTSDAGVAWSTVVSRLSSDQLRLHYLIYASARQRVIQQGFSRSNNAHSIEIVLHFTPLFALAGMTVTAFADAIDGLMREGLIGDGYHYAPTSQLFEKEAARRNTTVEYPHESGLRVSMSVHGIRLFVWGNGAGDKGIDAYIDPSITLAAVDNPLPTVMTMFVKDDVVKTVQPGQEPPTA